MARVLGENPARMFGLHPRKGSIRVGADADLLIWDPTAKGEIHVADHRGIAGWTLYEDWKTTGRPWMTLLRGQTLLEERPAPPKTRLRPIPPPRRSPGPHHQRRLLITSARAAKPVAPERVAR